MKSKWVANTLLALGIGLICLTAGTQTYYAYVRYTMFKNMEAYVIDTSYLYSEPIPEQPGSLSTPEHRAPEGYIPLFRPVKPNPEAPSASPPSTGQDSSENVPDEQQKQPEKPGMALLATMEIPKIKVKMPIFEGTQPAQLAVGIGHITGTALPGQTGNCSVAGHRSGSAAKPFEHLNRLETGDIVKFTAGHNTYEYEVFDKFVVDPTDTWVLKQGKQDSIVTIITCEYVSITVKRRLIVQARLINP